MGLQMQASAGSASTVFYMRDKAGNVGPVEIDRGTLSDPEDGEKLCQIAGYSDVFTITSEQYGEKSMIRLLYRIADGPSKGEAFSVMYGATLGTKARLAEVVSAILGRAIKPGESVDFDAILGTKIYLLTKLESSPKGYYVTRHGSARAYKEPATKAPKPAADTGIWGDDL